MIIIPSGFSSKYFMREADRWGLAGSGILYYCPADNTILLLRRSDLVEDPGVWGIPGGAIMGTDEYYDEEEESPEYSQDELIDSAFSEAEEELGHFPEHEEVGESYTTHNKNFAYTTFLVMVNINQKEAISNNIELNWEHSEAEWFRADRLPEDIHPGVVSAVKNLILRQPVPS